MANAATNRRIVTPGSPVEIRVPNPKEPPIVTPADISNAKRHLIYHIWPMGNLWLWNVNQLRRRIDQFDGVRSIGVATGPGTATLAEVQAAFKGVRIDNWIHRDNDPKMGEGATFLDLMRTLPRDGITFYGHTKGVKYALDAPELPVVKRWVDLMYRVSLESRDAVERHLSLFPMTGSFKRYGDFNLPGSNRWHYSGTFFWFRNADVFAANWDQLYPNFYGCVEAWPGFLFPAATVGCLFGDNAGLPYANSEITKWEMAFPDLAKAAKQRQAVVPSTPAKPKQDTIPVRSVSQPWRGTITKKPWEYDITAIIPLMEPDRSFEFVLKLLRLQTERPYILLVDTGNNPEATAWLATLRAPDLEVFSLPMNGVCHPSEPVSIALDAAVSRSQSRFTFFTHSDCFLRKKTALSELKQLAIEHVVAGHQITKRPYKGWETEFGHTMLMVDQDVCNDRNIRWSMRDVMRHEAHPEFWPDYRPCAIKRPNHPDTETGFNRCLQREGIKGHFTGNEQNFVRNVDSWIDHVRSLASSKVYCGAHHAKAMSWLPDAVTEAKQRIAEWSKL